MAVTVTWLCGVQITHWQSPHMHAYFPALNSFPSLLGDMLADAIGCVGFTWVRQSLHLYVVSHIIGCLGFTWVRQSLHLYVISWVRQSLHLYVISHVIGCLGFT